jgi:hypothetical protein
VARALGQHAAVVHERAAAGAGAPPGAATQSLTRADGEQLRDWLLTEGRRRGGVPGGPLSPRPAVLTLGRVKAVLELACQDGRLAVNPLRYVRMPSQPKREGTTWSEAELHTVDSLLAAAGCPSHSGPPGAATTWPPTPTPGPRTSAGPPKPAARSTTSRDK